MPSTTPDLRTDTDAALRRPVHRRWRRLADCLFARCLESAGGRLQPAPAQRCSSASCGVRGPFGQKASNTEPFARGWCCRRASTIGARRKPGGGGAVGPSAGGAVDDLRHRSRARPRLAAAARTGSHPPPPASVRAASSGEFLSLAFHDGILDRRRRGFPAAAPAACAAGSIFGLPAMESASVRRLVRADRSFARPRRTQHGRASSACSMRCNARTAKPRPTRSSRRRPRSCPA